MINKFLFVFFVLVGLFHTNSCNGFSMSVYGAPKQWRNAFVLGSGSHTDTKPPDCSLLCCCRVMEAEVRFAPESFSSKPPAVVERVCMLCQHWFPWRAPTIQRQSSLVKRRMKRGLLNEFSGFGLWFTMFIMERLCCRGVLQSKEMMKQLVSAGPLEASDISAALCSASMWSFS